jgi:hypothetical protein
MFRKPMSLAIVACMLASSSSAFASSAGPNEPGLSCEGFQRHTIRPGGDGWKALWDIRFLTKDEKVFRIPRGTVLQAGVPYQGQDIGAILDQICQGYSG